jgi:hypothetical protein
MPTDLVTLTQAKQSLRLPLDVDLDDDALYAKLEHAHALVLDYVKTRCTDDQTVKDAWVATVNAWTSDTAPPAVKAAILEMVADLDADRGDRTDANEEQRHWALSPRAAGFLSMKRDPVLR